MNSKRFVEDLQTAIANGSWHRALRLLESLEREPSAPADAAAFREVEETLRRGLDRALAREVLRNSGPSPRRVREKRQTGESGHGIERSIRRLRSEKE